MENEELVQHLGAAKDAQRQLTAEVRTLPSSLRGTPNGDVVHQGSRDGLSWVHPDRANTDSHVARLGAVSFLA